MPATNHSQANRPRMSLLLPAMQVSLNGESLLIDCTDYSFAIDLLMIYPFLVLDFSFFRESPRPPGQPYYDEDWLWGERKNIQTKDNFRKHEESDFSQESKDDIRKLGELDFFKNVKLSNCRWWTPSCSTCTQTLSHQTWRWEPIISLPFPDLVFQNFFDIDVCLKIWTKSAKDLSFTFINIK